MEEKYNIEARNIRQKLKDNQKGITLITMAVTIVLMILLVGVTVELSTDNIDKSEMISFVSYMQAIQTKVDFIAENNDEYLEYGTILSDTKRNALQEILNKNNEVFLTTTDSTYLRYFDSKHIKTDLELENIDDEIVVDFNTREVISLNGTKYENEMYYSQYNLPGGQALKQQTEEVNRNLNWNEIVSNINGLNATFTIKGIGITNGTLSYGKEDSLGIIKWKTITNYTKKNVDVTTENITESGTYYFRLVDNTSGKDNIGSNNSYPSVELKLTNTPKLQGNLTDLSTSYNYSNINDSTKWAYATDKTDTANLKYYVWIPRFVYKLDGNNKLSKLQFLRGTSDITTEGSYISTTEWTEPEAFTSGANRLTGVWVFIDTPNKSRHRHNRYIKNRNNIKIKCGGDFNRPQMQIRKKFVGAILIARKNV